MSAHPTLSVAIIGASATGIHAAEQVLCRDMGMSTSVRVDLFDARPSAPGLIRAHLPFDGAVEALATEHVTPHLRFIGNLRIGHDIPASLLGQYYDEVISAVDKVPGYPPGKLNPSPDTPGRDLVADLRAAGFPITTWHGWFRLDETVRRGHGGWCQAVAAAHGIPQMP